MSAVIISWVLRPDWTMIRAFLLAKIEGFKELLEKNDLGTLDGRISDKGFCHFNIPGFIRGACHLYGGHFNRLHFIP
jgi:hypothetical protein